MKLLFKIFFFVVCFVTVERFCHKQTEGFCLYKVISSSPFASAWQPRIALSDEEKKDLCSRLDQPYFFLASGGQCYAFLSADRTTVLKLFKIHHMHPLPALESLSLPSFLSRYQQQWIELRQKKAEHIFGSCKIAYEQLKEETGFIYLHLDKTTHLRQHLTLVDKLGIAHTIDLDQTEFALQKRADLALPTLDRLIKQNDIEKAKQCVDSLLKLILLRCQKGIGDDDPVIKRNFGYIGTQAIEIDLGSFSKQNALKKPYMYKRELHYQTLKLKEWIDRRHPELSLYITSEIERHLNENAS